MTVRLKPLSQQIVVVAGAFGGIGLATARSTAEKDHARNYTEREPRVPPPVYQPDEVARAILHAAVHPVRDIHVGSSAHVMSALGNHAPRPSSRSSSLQR